MASLNVRTCNHVLLLFKVQCTYNHDCVHVLNVTVPCDRVAVSRSSDVPYFGPSIPEGGIFQKSEKFRNFLLTKR